jgi:regulator of sigma E protease
METLLNGLNSFFWVLVLIGVMIMIHELGHYWAARFFDVKVDAFSFGFGPRLFGFRRGETDFRVSAILFGGYVKMAGEQPGDEQASDPRSFQAKPRWQRLIIAFAGPFMNVVLAVGLLTGLYMVRFPKTPDSIVPGMIGMVQPNSAAAEAGIQEGDRIVAIDSVFNPTWEDIFFKELSSADRPIRVTLARGNSEFEVTVTPKFDPRNGVGTAGWVEQSEIQIGQVEPGMDADKKGIKRGDVLVSVNGHPIRSTYKLRELIKASQGKPVEVVYLRDGAQKSVTVQPMQKLDPTTGKMSWMIGVSMGPRVIYSKLGFVDAFNESIHQNIKSASLIYQFLRNIVQQRMSPKSLEGPIRIAQLSGDAAKEGVVAFLGLMAMVSLNLAIFNLLPIPILDGGLILMLLLEMIIRKDLSLQVKEAVIKVGFVFLMIVVMFVLYNDIAKVTGG